jgi:predicted aconitase
VRCALLILNPFETQMLQGQHGPALAFAMRLLTQLGKSLKATRMIPVTRAHIDGCLYHGQVSLDFVQQMIAWGARVRIPTTLNVGSLDMLHPQYNHFDLATLGSMRAQMEGYKALGCAATFTCAPYQLPSRPVVGEQIAWAESNAIVFANSVLGACTNRYGDFIDLCAALTGCVPEAGLHLAENRRGEVVFQLGHLPKELLEQETFYPVLGHWMGQRIGKSIPVLEGLPTTTTEDQLKALGAAAASSGSVAMFHAVGLTPEAPTLDAALQGLRPEKTINVTLEDLSRARDELSSVASGEDLSAVILGTPHYSLHEFEILVNLLEGKGIHPKVTFWVNTHRLVLAELESRGWLEKLEEAGVRLVVDTCTYFNQIIGPQQGAVMTSSAKCAYYAPGNLGVRIAFGSTLECVQSAVKGQVWRDVFLWS